LSLSYGCTKSGDGVINAGSLAWAFGFGVVAAAPVGPVNMVAIRRGLVAHWTHALWVALGSVSVEACYIALALYGGNEILSRVRDFERIISGPAAGVVIVIGMMILRKALKNPQRVLSDGPAPARVNGRTTIARDILSGALLTLLNPATLLYWVVGAGPTWLGKASPNNAFDVFLGLAAATCGLASWFAFVIYLVRFRPQNVRPRFFRRVNFCCGLALIVMGVVLAVHLLAGRS
jgi:threonine/homoserine/homoserine lactone efflux protein